MRELRDRGSRWWRWIVTGILLPTAVLVANADETKTTRPSARTRVTPSSSPITLGVTTDRPSYSAGQTMNITARATYDDGSPVQQVKKAKVQIKDSAGRRVVRGALENQGPGAFTYAYAILSGANPGSWEIQVEIEDAKRNKAEEEIYVNVTTGSTPCPDADGDGYRDSECGGDDCNDADPLIHPGAAEICGDGVDQDCSGADLQCEPPPCADADGDGYEDEACGGDDCNDADPLIHPGATETCGDGVDQNCSGGDLSCGEGHAGLKWSGPETCLQCHQSEAHEVHGSVMYQWKGDTPDMVNGEAPQGKNAGAVNSYCINILGNWNACGSCHVCIGALP